MAKRSDEKWNSQFLIANKIFESMSELYEIGGEKLLMDASVSFRNPIVFDNETSDASFKLPFYIEGHNEKMTHDHLVGMSNIVLYIYKKELYKKWNEYQDFINTLKSLQVLLLMPKSLNDKKSFKNWQFNYSNIDECIYWNKKLKREGIFSLTAQNQEFEASVDDVWEEWYNQFNIFLCSK